MFHQSGIRLHTVHDVSTFEGTVLTNISKSADSCYFEVQLQRAAKLCGDEVEFIYLDGRSSQKISLHQMPKVY